jgi:hypothetical protein
MFEYIDSLLESNGTAGEDIQDMEAWAGERKKLQSLFT